MSDERDVIDAEFRVVLPARNFPVWHVIWWMFSAAGLAVAGYQETRMSLVPALIVAAACIWPAMLIWRALNAGATIPPEQAEALAERLSARGVRRRTYS
jgi:hypothetical protein